MVSLDGVSRKAIMENCALQQSWRIMRARCKKAALNLSRAFSPGDEED
jgi:hypothetical protein